MKTKFIVIDNALCTVNPRQPDTAYVIAISATHGGSCQDGRQGCEIWIPKRARPATLEDFQKNFNLYYESYQADTENYEFPTE